MQQGVRNDICEAEGAGLDNDSLGAGVGLDDNVPGVGAGRDGVVQDKREQGTGAGRQEQGGTNEATDSDPEGEGAVQQGVNDYLLADPRLAEAPEDGNATVEVLTGADCSAPQALPGSNHPHSQWRSSEGGGGRKRAGARDESQAKPKDGAKDEGTGSEYHQAKTKDIGAKDEGTGSKYQAET